MSQSQALIAAAVLDAYPIAQHEKLLDVGGGEGAFIATAAARAPQLKLALLDLPAVAERARSCLATRGLADRVEVFGSNFLDDPLPAGSDLVSLIRIVHDHDDDSALKILSAVRTALIPGGTILIAEPVGAAPGADPICDAYFGFYLLAMGGGRGRPISEHRDLLRATGFAHVKIASTRQPMLATVITARAM
jgi:demethylspheroidene O-methyltransferase